MNHFQDKNINGLKLAAIDLDGTLLSEDLTISAANLEAIEKLEEAGLQVVLATGRHYESTQRFLPKLPNIRWLVSLQGAEVSDVERNVILTREFMPPEDVHQLLGLSDACGCSPVVFFENGFATDTTRKEDLDFLTALTGFPAIRLSRSELLIPRAFKVLWIGNPTVVSMLPLLPEIESLPFQKLRTHVRVLEFMPPGITKGSGLETLSSSLNIRSEDAVVFGDSDNDIPMFEWAGLSIAMPHGFSTALSRATKVGPEAPPESALARAVEFVLHTPIRERMKCCSSFTPRQRAF